MAHPAGSRRDLSARPALALKGQLVPDGPVVVHRAVLDDDVVELARQVWVPLWDLPDGETHHQPLLSYPGVNVTVEPTDSGVHFPVRGLGSRTLRGAGWAAGLLMRPGAGWLLFNQDHAQLLGQVRPIPRGDALVAEVRAAAVAPGTVPSQPGAGLSQPGAVTSFVEEVVSAYTRWLVPLLERVDDTTRLLNAVCAAAEEDGDIRTCTELANRFDLSERSLQRLVGRRTGLSPRWLIQRRRLQEAATRLRSEPDTSLAEVAAELGYADQAHFTREFGAVVGDTPGRYRARFRRVDPTS